MAEFNTPKAGLSHLGGHLFQAVFLLGLEKNPISNCHNRIRNRSQGATNSYALLCIEPSQQAYSSVIWEYRITFSTSLFIRLQALQYARLFFVAGPPQDKNPPRGAASQRRSEGAFFVPAIRYSLFQWPIKYKKCPGTNQRETDQVIKRKTLF